MKRLFTLTALFIVYYTTSHGQPGRLDPSFGKNGIVRTGFNALLSQITSVSQVLKKSDGTMYLIAVTSRNATEGDIPTSLIIHVFANGTTDSSFGNKGNSQYADFHSTAAALQANGKIVIAGYASTTNGLDFALARYNTDGTLDTAFSGDGKLTTDFGSRNDVASSVAIQSDGKIVVAGSAYRPGTYNTDFALARYNIDGSLDTAFSKDGKLTTDFASASDVANSVAIQADGKIILAGSAYKPESRETDFALARFNADGTPDTDFSGDGKLTTDFASAYDGANSVAIQANGKIVVAGSTQDSKGETNFALTRYNKNGTLDTAFSEDGKLTTDFASGIDVANSVAIQADGKIVVAGSSIKASSEDGSNFALARYNTDGALDVSFSEDGKLITDFATQSEAANSVAIQSDGKIVAAGNIDVARYNTNGNLDNYFSTDGKLTVDISIYTRTGTAYTSTAIQTDGKIVMAGYISKGYDSRGEEGYAFALARYNTDGTLDSSFSGDGEQTTDFESWQNRANAVAIQRDGKIIVAGSASNPWGGGDFALARYNTDGTPDTAFAEDGKQTTDFGFGEGAQSVAIQSDGKIVVTGTTHDTYNEFGDFALARYKIDGTLDASFSGDGKQTTDFASGFDAANSVAIQSDGKIVAAGYTFPDGVLPDQDNGSQTEDLALARYNTDGTLDVSFAGDGKQTIDFASRANLSTSFLMAIQSDGKIVAAGSAASDADFDFALARCNIDGTLDTSFSEDGKQTIDFGSDNDIARTIAIQSDGKIIAAGNTGSYPASKFALVRCNNNGSADSSFGQDGKQVTDASEGNDFLYDIAISGNKLSATGYGGYSSDQFGIAARYLLDGESNNPPTVSLTAPNNNATYLAPAADIKLSAAASDGDGAITKVEFYNDSSLLHTETVIPYGYVWRNVALGNYTLTTKAYDNSGNVTTSAPVHISVVPNKPPVVSIVSPANNQSYTTPTSIHFEAATSDTDGRITNVKFYNETTLLRTEYKLPYTYNWIDVPTGTYSITAVATDNWGAQTTSAPVTITVTSSSALVSSKHYSENKKNALNDALSLRLSPNPATNIVNIYTSGLQQNKPATLSIISVSGIVLKTINNTGSNQTIPIDVSALANGVYTLKIIIGDRILYKQFVKL